MSRVIILMGLPGSGKTRWAKDQQEAHPGQYKRLSKDALRAMLDNGEYSKDNEQFIIKVRNALMLQALGDGKDVIIDDTNLHPRHIEEIRALASINLAEVEIQDFTNVPLEVCIERDAQRETPVGEEVIRTMYARYLADEGV